MPRLSPQPAGGATCLEDGMSDFGDLIAVGLLAERNGLGLTANEAHAIGERIAPHLGNGRVITWTCRNCGESEQIHIYGANSLDAARSARAAAEEALAEVRRWVESIGATNLATGRRIVKADVLAVIDAKFRAHEAQSASAAAARSAPPER